MKEFSTYYFENENKEELHLAVHLINSKKDLKKYDTFLNKLPENPFMKKELLPKTSDLKIGYITLHTSNKTLLVLLPFICRKINKEINGNFYYDIISPYGFVGPLIKSGVDEKTMAQFWTQVDKWYLKNNVVSEFIRFNFTENYLGYTGSMVPTLKMVCGKIREDQEQWINFKPKVRNNIRKALRNGLHGIVYHKNIANNIIHEFHKIYTETMNRHEAEPRYRYSLEFFKEFILNNPDSCSIAVVYKEKIPVSVELILLSGEIAYSFLGGTDETYFFMRPNDLLKLIVINWARENSYSYYFLGGGRSEKDTLYRYKKSFFPKDDDHPFYTGRKILNQEIYGSLVRMNPKISNTENNDFFPLYRYNEHY